ncbi:hypothetical protein QBC34DRAFT_25415 [Podospora aff. communis PSN243]|uniref:F-box domain-containing protein n=1 Tax=Podospora aff. communis PSN243 TaxID=3040156 RepID=A0AAV9G3Q6_9PEZI|nr:hypothetical protein QBC34DRAFT_25415 [Podospora aff. communis PSN243]
MSQSLSSTVATGTDLTMETPSILLRLPAELRIKIFRSLYWRKGNSTCGGTFTPSLHTPLPTDSRGMPYVGMRRVLARRSRLGGLRRVHKLKTLTTLMLVCKLFYFEIISIIYDRTFGFFDLPFCPSANATLLLTRHLDFNTRFFFDGGPARHLRRVRVHITHGFPYPRKVWPPSISWNSDPMIAAEELLWSLARNATGLETLELGSNWWLRNVLGSTLSDTGYAIAELQDGFSWSNPLLELDLSEKTSGDESRAGSEDTLSKEMLVQAIAELLAPGNKCLQEAVRQKLDAAIAVSDDPVGFSGSMQSMQKAIYSMECAKLFWGVRLLGILKSFSPTLRTVCVAYTEDKQWMDEMRNCLGVEVESLPSKSRLKTK